MSNNHCGQASANVVAAEPINATAIEALAQAASAVYDVETRLAQVTTKLVGTYATGADADAKPTAEAQSVFGAVGDMAYGIRRSMARCHEALAALERQVP